MDPARAAAMSDPELNRWFRRRWAEPATRPPPSAPVLDPLHTTPEQVRLQLLETWRLERSHGQKGKSA
jgi:hypothetical protein